MIICDKRKIAIFLVPKTGTISLCASFGRVKNLYYNKHSHMTYDMALLNFKQNLSDFKSYKFFAFCREPVDRFISAMTYFRRTLYKQLISIFYGNEIPISCASTNPYQFLPQELKDKIEAITYTQMLDHKYFQFEDNSLIKPQHFWLDVPEINIKYLNFNNYNQEVSNLLRMFDLDPTGIIPQLNYSTKYASDILNETERNRVLEMYKKDYEFFQKINMVF